MTIRRFYPGGVLKLEMRCRNGVPHGPARQFYESGQLQIDMNYKNGIPSGPYTLYYETGNPQMTATLQDGKVSGQVQRFKADGTPIDPALLWGENEEKLWVAGDVFVPWETCLTQAINSSLGLLMTETAWAEGFEYENDGQTYFIPLKQWRTPEQADTEIQNAGYTLRVAVNRSPWSGPIVSSSGCFQEKTGVELGALVADCVQRFRQKHHDTLEYAGLLQQGYGFSITLFQYGRER